MIYAGRHIAQSFAKKDTQMQYIQNTLTSTDQYLSDLRLAAAIWPWICLNSFLSVPEYKMQSLILTKREFSLISVSLIKALRCRQEQNVSFISYYDSIYAIPKDSEKSWVSACSIDRAAIIVARLGKSTFQSIRTGSIFCYIIVPYIFFLSSAINI